MAEEGSERENGGLVAMDSMESRWVFQDEDETEMEEDDDDLGQRTTLDSEDDESGEQRLIRTGPRIDSFDVEALEVPGAQRNDYEVHFFCFLGVSSLELENFGETGRIKCIIFFFSFFFVLILI